MRSESHPWWWGEDVPTPTQLRALAATLDLGSDTAETWIATAEAEVLSIEIVEDPLVPPLTVVTSGLEADPWSTPPEKRIRPPRLDREALIGKREGRRNGKARASNGNGSNGSASVASSTLAVVPLTPDQPDASMERLLKRQARSDERRVRRELIAEHRVERAKENAEGRLRAAEQAEAIRRAPLPVPPPPALAPAPAGTANTGSVFPIPDTRQGSERVTYQGLGEISAESDRITYTLRLIGTIAAMALFVGLLWWAFVSLGDGLGAILDLFRGGESLGAPSFTGLILPG